MRYANCTTIVSIAIKQILKFVASLQVAALWAAAALAQAPPRVVSALATAADVAVDGFDDPAWREVRPASGLFQQDPDPGKPATLDTQCRVLATRRALVFRFSMEQPGGEIVARELRRDAVLDNDDQIQMTLDTNHDRRNAYYFATNPNGIRVDGLITEEQGPSLDWDTVWEVRVRRRPGGWDAIFTIPYAALTFPSDPEGIWGFNFSREIKRRTETDRWTGWQRPFSIAKVSLEGELRGVQSGHGRTLRELTPYASGAVDHREHPINTNGLGKIGGDFRLGLGESSEADVTVNTDFAETEIDDQQFNFGRTALFFPEKRQFFLQRAQTFSFGSSNSTLPFFSRTIGLSAEENPAPIPIDGGLKLVGRWSQADFGALAVRTRAASGAPRTDSFVGRIKQDLGHASYVGAIFTDIERSTTDPSRSWSRTYGADAGVSFTPEWTAGGYYLETRNPGIGGETKAWSADLLYQGEYANGEVRRTNVGSGFLPQMGFVAQSGIHETVVDLEATPRPHVLGLKELSFEAFTDVKYNEDSSLNEREYQYTFRALWLSGAYTDDDIVDVFDENLKTPLRLTDRVEIAPGAYHFVRHQMTYGSDPTRTLAVQGNANFGGYYGGTRNSYTGRLFWKPSEHVGASLIENYNVVRLPEGRFDLSLFSFRLDWNPSTRWITSAILQSDNIHRLTNVQVIARWLVDPATDVFAVFDRQIGAGFDRPGTRIAFKIRRAFDL